MKRSIVAAVAASLLAVAACAPETPEPTVRDAQTRAAATAANSIRFTGNAEIDNVKRRLELTANPNLLGFIVLLNEAGQPIMYTSVKGKVTSGGKRLTRTDELIGGVDSYGTRAAPSDEGTYGSSAPYVFFWTTEGQYIQWDGGYLYSDRPFRLNTQPLVVQAIPAELVAAGARGTATVPTATPGATTAG